MSEERAKIIIDELDILDFLKELKKIRSRIWMWQTIPIQLGGGRRVHLGAVRNINFDRKSIDIQPMVGSKFKFIKSKEIFLYHQDRQIGFRAKVKELDDEFIHVYFPQKLNLLTGYEFSDFKIVDNEDEEHHRHMREAARKSATANQYVEVLRYFGVNKNEKSVYRLHDISSGGLGIITLDPGDFIKGEKIEILSINGKATATKIQGEVVAIRRLDGDDDLFKVGVKFF